MHFKSVEKLFLKGRKLCQFEKYFSPETLVYVISPKTTFTQYNTVSEIIKYIPNFDSCLLHCSVCCVVVIEPNSERYSNWYQENRTRACSASPS